MLYKLAIEIDRDDDGLFFAVVIDAEDDAVLFITDSYRTPESTEAAAQEWIDKKGERDVRALPSVAG